MYEMEGPRVSRATPFGDRSPCCARGTRLDLLLGTPVTRCPLEPVLSSS